MVFRVFFFAVVFAILPSLPAAEPPSVLLISLDGFRWDYCDLHPDATPHLRALRDGGASARALIPCFPSNTFPNHYSIVTGLYPAHHGMLNNKMFDPVRGLFFSTAIPGAVNDPAWWGGEPVWVTAILQGRPGVCFYWPGSEAAIKGIHPSSWRPYDYTKVTFAQRCDWLFAWLGKPAAERPAVATFYMEEANDRGHKLGPASPDLIATLKMLDNQIGTIVARLESARLRDSVTLVIVSDHGMTEISKDRWFAIDDFIAIEKVQVDFEGPVIGLRPLDPSLTPAALVAAFAKAAPHLTAYEAKDLPARLHFTGHPRIPPVVIIPALGWEMTAARSMNEWRTKGLNKGDHGFDPIHRDMHGILIVNGPRIKPGVIIDAVENIHLYHLLCALADLKPAANDGDRRLIQTMLK